MNRAQPPTTRRETTYRDVGNADIASLHGCNLLGQRRSGCRGANICRPTWQGLFLQSCCISSIHGGQMWEVRKMHGAIFSPSIHGHNRIALLAPCGIRPPRMVEVQILHRYMDVT